MIIKNMDEHSAELATIERLLLSDPPNDTADALLRDKRTILSALQHKRDAAYHLDFYFTDTPDWVVFHDLRLQMGGIIANYDHLLISREMDIYVIESKHYNATLKVSAAREFCYYVDDHPLAVDSPAERNQQHIDFLINYLASNGLLPTRFGLSIRPNFHSIVLISPDSSLQLPECKVDLGCEVVNADRFLEQFSKKLTLTIGSHDFVALARQISTDNLRTLAEKLARRHIPRSIDVSRRYGLSHTEVELDKAEEGVKKCAACSKRITARVVRYCYDNHELFAGKAYCFDCQKGIAFKAVM